MIKDIVKLAEEYCLYYHEGQKRKGGNQVSYAVHPFTVRDILVESGYDDPETQAIALLHDTVEDTKLVKTKREIESRFGPLVYNGVYVLSENTAGKFSEKLVPLFKNLGIEYLDEKGNLTSQAYKARLMFSRDTIKQVKIADMIHNTSSLSDLSLKGIEKKIHDAEEFYIPLGQAVAPIMVRKLIKNIAEYRDSEHYKQHFRNIHMSKSFGRI
jgi:(p)ppGpp synthase/HD superfamily hydrolase